MAPYIQDSLPPSRSKTPVSVKEGKSLTPAPAKGISYFTPAQDPPSGTALGTQDGSPIPKLFQPLKIRGIEMQNRIWVSPMCQYSAHEGFQTMWHTTHYGGIAQRGPGLVMLEAAAVQARGRITPEDSGIWLDAHIDGLRKHVEFAHSQNVRIGIQLAHAGFKASMVAPWLSANSIAEKDVGGWPDDAIGPSNEPFDEGYPTPRAMTLAEIDHVKKDFIAAVERAVNAGFDVVEFHFAHGYLVPSFMSPAINKRTDKYGGSFENRVRLALELVEGARAVMPESMPLFVRISATDWLDNNPEYVGGTWNLDEATKLAQLLADRGVDVLDVSSGGIHRLQKIKGGPGYQAPLAKHIKKAVGDRMLVSTVGSITTGMLAEELISGGKDDDDTPLDLVAAGRGFQKNPGLVWSWADDLGVSIQLAHQIGWGFGGRGGRKANDTAKSNIP
ncbi:putative NADPH dehydrogenase-like protein [Hapsidospora chrysogenum ATCC 11550]|uniref:Putative NADPH dehydrogenase-like protein n=1 Tax=Hapsidospora chrysogenum (strain ATCC 11550 / CBS 779.69 / DSM 880 / IAM 14645 / JCM 23072 / IMI 49137) TaxID=857340 RepID=A0A086TH66_HAPC1|nr:putative NADPH dehydrogenase-like protein [Hapsidospora chrysogenum ATCC 11550]